MARSVGVQPPPGDAQRVQDLQQLQREYRHMELNRRAYAEESQQLLRKQQVHDVGKHSNMIRFKYLYGAMDTQYMRPKTEWKYHYVRDGSINWGPLLCRNDRCRPAASMCRRNAGEFLLLRPPP